MNHTDKFTRHTGRPSGLLCARGLQPQRGVVLVITLILLVVISLLAITSMRNAGSSESVMGNVRTTELATQAAEIALRHCESSVLKVQMIALNNDTTSPEAKYVTTFKADKIQPASETPYWKTPGNWESATSLAYQLPLSMVNQAGMGSVVTYKRPPECMVERLRIMQNGTVDDQTSFVVTARGFGPEVAPVSGGDEGQVGSEVWLQTHIELEYKKL